MLCRIHPPFSLMQPLNNAFSIDRDLCYPPHIRHRKEFYCLYTQTQDFFRLVYIDPAFLRRFHAEINQDPAAVIPAWNVTTRSRILTFRTPLSAPALITNLVGADSISVQETQIFHVVEDAGIQLESIPAPQVPGAHNFSTAALISIENHNDGDGESAGGEECHVTAVVKVTARGPWGLTSTIETFMGTAAEDSICAFFGYCEKYITQLQSSDGALETTLTLLPSISEILEAGGREDDDNDDEQKTEGTIGAAEYFDVEESLGGGGDRGGGGAAGLPSVELTHFEGLEPGQAAVAEVLLLYMRYFAKNGDDMTSMLHRIDDRLARLEEEEEAQRKKGREWFWRGGFEGGVSGRQMMLLTMVALSSAAITALLLKRRSTPSSS